MAGFMQNALGTVGQNVMSQLKDNLFSLNKDTLKNIGKNSLQDLKQQTLSNLTDTLTKQTSTMVASTLNTGLSGAQMMSLTSDYGKEIARGSYNPEDTSESFEFSDRKEQAQQLQEQREREAQSATKRQAARTAENENRSKWYWEDEAKQSQTQNGGTPAVAESKNMLERVWDYTASTITGNASSTSAPAEVFKTTVTERPTATGVAGSVARGAGTVVGIGTGALDPNVANGVEQIYFNKALNECLNSGLCSDDDYWELKRLHSKHPNEAWKELKKLRGN